MIKESYYKKLKMKRIKRQASSSKQCLTAGVGYDRMYLERNIMDNEQLKRIADAMEEILRLVKKDQEKFERYKEETSERWDEGDMRDHFTKAKINA